MSTTRKPSKFALSLTLLAAGGAALAAVGCSHLTEYAPPEGPMPVNTVLMSSMMRELSAQPGFTESMLAELDKGGKKGPALLTPTLIDNLRQRIVGKDWQGLDRFPGWKMSQINPTVRVVGHVAGKSETAEDLSKVHPGASPATAQSANYLDIGPYALDKPEDVSLDTPSTLPGFTTDGIVTKLGDSVVRGDGPNALAAEHSESQRLADVLNRLSANGLEHSAAFTASVNGVHSSTPQDLITALQLSGHQVVVNDARYFANFGHFHYKGQEVMMPFWVNSQIVVPDTGRRPLLIPVSHAEYEWHIRGPKINADVSYYFGVDGKSEWRTMDTLDQAWVLKRNAHEYRDQQAVEVTRLTSALTVAYMHLHAAHPELPFGGYYALGVCQDGVSAIESKMTGKVTLFPNTADGRYFTDPRDAEINKLMVAIPKDRDGKQPEPERIFGSLPADPGPNEDFSAITIPGLSTDLSACYRAWQNGTLHHVHPRISRWFLYGGLAIGCILAVSFMRRRNIEDF